MESAKLNALRYRSRRYHPTHLRANTRINDINPPEQHRALRFRILIGNARTKRTPTQVVEIIRARGTGAIGETSAARIRAFRKFLAKLLTDCGGGNCRTEETPWKLAPGFLAMMYLPAISKFLAFGIR
jgi:hypothetical protein